MKRYITRRKHQPTVRGYAPKHLPEVRKYACVIMRSVYRDAVAYFNNRTVARKAARQYTINKLVKQIQNG
jgi:hypothetical protein